MKCDIFFKRETAISTALAIITILMDFGSMRSPVEATTYRDSDSKQHLYAVKTKLVEQIYHGKSH